MTSCERIKCALRHEEPDRVPITDGPWHATITRWKKEGFPEDISVEEYFGYEMVTFNSIDLSPRFPTKVIEKNERCVVAVDSCGGIRRSFRDGSTTPEVIDWPIKSKKDWPKIKERLFPDYTRVDWATGLSNVRRAHEEGKFVAYLAAMGYDHLQGYLKSEELLIAMEYKGPSQGAFEEGVPHSFEYSLVPYTQRSFSYLTRKGLEFNTPFVDLALDSVKGDIPLETSFFRTKPDNIVLSSLRKIEDGIVLRVYEAKGERCQGQIEFFRKLKNAERTDLLGRSGKKMRISNGNTLEFTLLPYQIRTFKVSLGDS